MKYVSLLNTGFSGSTVVSMMLSSQPGVVGFGDTYFSTDPKHIPKHPCTCGQWYDECEPRVESRNAIHRGGEDAFEWPTAAAVPVPQSMSHRMRKYWPLSKSASLPFISAIPDGLRTKLFTSFYRQNQLMVEGLAESGKYSTYIDGCKDLIRFELLRSVIPNMRILHIVRHPGAYLYHFHKAGDTQYALRLKHWLRYNKQCRQLSRRISPGNYFPVTYESIVKQPEVFLAEFARFIDVENFDLTEPNLLRRSQIHVIGNRMREDADRVLDYSNSWRGMLPSEVEQTTDNIVKNDNWFSALYAG